EGGVLSTRVVTGTDVVEFPAASVAVTRRSYGPSMTPVVSHKAVWLENAPPCGAISYETVVTPEPPSIVLDVSVTEPCTGSPVLSIVALGAVLSIRRFVTGTGAVSTLAPASVATERKS